MQFYHHPLSLQSQKARLALEEKGLDYCPRSINPLKGRNLDAEFFRDNPAGDIPVLVNGNNIFRGSLSIIQFVDSFSPSLGGDNVDKEVVNRWMLKIDSWQPKLFTLSNLSEKYIRHFSKFKRQVVIARMAENPDLADKYHMKLHEMHSFEDVLKNREAVAANKEQLISLLDDAEKELSFSDYLAGSAFSMADAMFIPILARIEFLNLAKEMTNPRVHVLQYWMKVKELPSFKASVGQYMSGFGKLRAVLPSVVNIGTRSLLRRY